MGKKDLMQVVNTYKEKLMQEGQKMSEEGKSPLEISEYIQKTFKSMVEEIKIQYSEEELKNAIGSSYIPQLNNIENPDGSAIIGLIMLNMLKGL